MERQDVLLHVRVQSASGAREEKEYFMAVSIKKTVVMIILALALLAGLFGWTMRMMAMPSSLPLHTGMHSSHAIAWYCPPPPRDC
jgi:hypothetical protein